MFATLSDRLTSTFKNLRTRGRLSEADIDATVREIRRAWLDADVAVSVVREFTGAVRERALSAEHAFLAKEKALPHTRELADGILQTELNPGTGAKPEAQGWVKVNYMGRLPDGSVFDQSTQPQWFRLDSVIAGWRSALTQMPVGAKWRLVIPSSQAYGADGAGDLIAPYTPLVFEIELLDSKK